MDEIKQRLLREYDIVFQEVANGQLTSIPVYGRGKMTEKRTFAGANGNWGLTTGRQRNDGTPGDLAYRNSVEKLIDNGFVSLRAIDAYQGKMRDIIGGNDSDILNVLIYLIKRIENGAVSLKYPEIDVTGDHKEGHVLKCYVNRYERDKSARDECINVKGCQCQVCGMEFKSTYGDLGRDFIHVHHLVPLNAIKGEYNVNPINDLIPICPNCHAMLHKLISERQLTTETEYRNSIDLLKQIISDNCKSK